MEYGEWLTFVSQMDIEDGVYALTISDDVLDPDCWPVHTIVVKDNKVIKQMSLYGSSVYDIPNMVGQSTEKLSVWTFLDTTGSHPEQFNSLMKIS